MLFGFISVKHILAFVRKIVTDLEHFAQRVEAKAMQKYQQASNLTLEAQAHAADAEAARQLAAKLSTAATAATPTAPTATVQAH